MVDFSKLVSAVGVMAKAALANLPDLAESAVIGMVPANIADHIIKPAVATAKAALTLIDETKAVAGESAAELDADRDALEATVLQHADRTAASLADG